MSISGLTTSYIPASLDGLNVIDADQIYIDGQLVNLTDYVPYQGANRTIDAGGQNIQTTHTATAPNDVVNKGVLDTTINNLTISIGGSFLDKVTTTPQIVIGNVSYTAQLSADDFLVPAAKKASLGSVLTVDANWQRSETDATVSVVQYFGSITSSMGIYQATSTQNFAILQCADLGTGTGKRMRITWNLNINEPSYNSSIQLFASSDGTTLNQYLGPSVSFTPSDPLYKVLSGTFVPQYRFLCIICITTKPGGVQTVRWYGLDIDEQGVELTNVTMPSLGADKVAVFNGNKQLVSSGVSTTTLNYLDVSSSVQTQLNAKASTIYVDSQDALKLNLSGSNANQNIVLGGYKVQSTANPTTNDDLTRKAYVDSVVLSAVTDIPRKADVRTGVAPNAQPGATMSWYFGTHTNNGVTPFSDMMIFNGWVDGSGGYTNMVSLNKGGKGIRQFQGTYGSSSNFSNYYDCVMTDLNSANVTLGGTLAMGGNKVTTSYTPVNAEDLTRKGYVDTQDDLRVLKAGDTMTGTLYNSGGDFHAYKGGDVNRSAILFANNADGASYTNYNGGLASWFGIGFKSTLDGITRYVYDTRSGASQQVGKMTAGGINNSGATGNRVAIYDVDKNLVSSSVTDTTLTYLDIGSSLVGLLNAKANLSGATFTGDISAPTMAIGTTTTSGYSLYVNGGSYLNGSQFVNGNIYQYGADFFIQNTPRGSGGRALVHDVFNILTINFGGDFASVKIGSDVSLGANAITSTSNPTTADQLSRKGYVDGVVANYLPLTGGTLSGALTVNGTVSVSNRFLGLPDASPTGNFWMGLRGTASEEDRLAISINGNYSTGLVDRVIIAKALRLAHPTANRVLTVDTNGDVVSSTVTPVTLSYLDVTSSVQNQIDTKASTSYVNSQLALKANLVGPNTFSNTHTFTSPVPITLSGLTASRVLQLDGSANVQASVVTTTELGYVSGVTSGLQGQIDTKASTTYVDSQDGLRVLKAGDTMTGTLGLTSTNVVEFGSGVSGKETNAGKIGYQTFTSGCLDVVGAGTPTLARRVRIWDRLGVGADPALALLQVGGGGTAGVAGDYITLNNTTYAANEMIRHKFLFGTLAGLYRSALIEARLLSGNKTDLSFQVDGGSGTETERLRVSSDGIYVQGSVGIGITNPDTELYVNGKAKFHTGTVSAPSNGINGGAGTRLILWPGDAVNCPYSLGIDSSTLWYGTPDGASHKWYNGTANVMSLNAGGNLIINNRLLNVVGGTAYAVPNNFMGTGSLTLGAIDRNYGGGSGWSGNTAGLLMECLNSTEIAVHDSGDTVASFMRYSGNIFTLGRNMGWGNATFNISGPLSCFSNVSHLANSFFQNTGVRTTNIYANGINFPNDGTGLCWGIGYSRIFDDGNLKIGTDDTMSFYTGMTLTGDGTLRTYIDGNSSWNVRNPNGGLTHFGYVDNNNYIRGNGTFIDSEAYFSQWIRVNNNNTGIYWQNLGRGIVSPEQQGNSYGNITTYATGRNGWSGYGVDSRWCFMANGNECGIHDNIYSWALKTGSGVYRHLYLSAIARASPVEWDRFIIWRVSENDFGGGYWYFNQAGGWGYTSDERIKKDIAPLSVQQSISFLKHLQPTTFRMKDTEPCVRTNPDGSETVEEAKGCNCVLQDGFIAQNILEACVVSGVSKSVLNNWYGYEQEMKKPEEERKLDKDTILGVNDRPILSHTVNAVKGLMEEIDILTQRNKILETWAREQEVKQKEQEAKIAKMEANMEKMASLLAQLISSK